MHAVLIHNSVLIYEIKKIAVLKKILNDGHLCLVTLELNSDRLDPDLLRYDHHLV